MTEFTGNGLQITAQDLGALSLSSEDDGRMFHHDGSSSIELTGGTTNDTLGFYIWDNSAKAWYPPFKEIDKLDGKNAGAFLHRDGSLAMQAAMDMGNYGIINLGEASGGTGGIHLNDNHVDLHSHTAGANIRLSDTNGLLIAEAIEGGDFDVPNGQLKEQGLRVATRSWSNTNFYDTTESDSRYYNVSGDSLSGVLDVATNDVVDGSTTVWDTSISAVPQSSLGGPAASLSAYPLANGDLSNSSVTINAGTGISSAGSVSLGGSVSVDVDDSRYVLESGDTMSGGLTVNATGDGFKLTSPNSDDHFWSVRDVSTSGGSDEARLIARDTTNAVTSLAVDLDATNGRLDISTGILAEAGNRVATRLWATGSNILHSDLADAPASAHHTKPGGGTGIAFDSTNNEFDANLGENLATDANNNIDVQQGEGSGLNAAQWEGYDLQKNGTDGTGVINFKT